jgi:glutathione gamma-glutamylcysteinyltransferase
LPLTARVMIGSMDGTLYRRPLPDDAIAFSSQEGRRVFAEALAAGGLDGYFPLAEQFHTQSDPSFCGLGSLVVALNALGIDPGRLWKGPWRWFAEDLLDCCVPLEAVRERGLDLDELGCLARCNGADVELKRPDRAGFPEWRAAIADAAQARSVLIASYDRKLLDQTGSGHFSPIGGYHRQRDLVLVLDVARFKYPPHWVSTEKLYRAMEPADRATGKPRGWLTLRARSQGIALGFSLRCDDGSWRGLASRLVAASELLASATDLERAIDALLPIGAHVELRAPAAAAHREALDDARATIQSLDLYARVLRATPAESAEVVTLLLIAMADRLNGAAREVVAGNVSGLLENQSLLAEVANLRAQLSAIWTQSEVAA